jgi:hypothetical protein
MYGSLTIAFAIGLIAIATSLATLHMTSKPVTANQLLMLVALCGAYSILLRVFAYMYVYHYRLWGDAGICEAYESITPVISPKSEAA